MLEKIELQNFQAHESLQVRLSPTITTIVGPTDCGKSALIRAIRWAALNKAGAKGFTTEGKKVTSVTLHTEAGSVVREVKGAVNKYSLDSEDFTAFKTAVPEPIEDVLSVSDLNFQFQHDSPFWFSLSAPEVSKRLNTIVDLTVMDTSLAYVGKREREAKAQETYLAKRSATKKEEALGLNWTKKARQQLTLLEKKEASIVAKEKRSRKLRSCIEKLDTKTEPLAYLKKVAAAFAVLERKKEKVEETGSMFTSVRGFLQMWDSSRIRVESLRRKKQALEKKYKKETKGICPLCGNKTHGNKTDSCTGQ